MIELTLEMVEEKKMSAIQCVKHFRPHWTDEECDYYAWEHTCFPFDTKTFIKQLNEQLSKPDIMKLSDAEKVKLFIFLNINSEPSANDLKMFDSFLSPDSNQDFYKMIHTLKKGILKRGWSIQITLLPTGVCMCQIMKHDQNTIAETRETEYEALIKACIKFCEKIGI